MKKQAGQMLMALILIMSVALAIGLSIIQKSLVDISTATKVEQSSKAFSAAEAGIEQALRGASSPNPVFLETQSSATASATLLLPQTAVSPNPQDGLEYPPLTKEEVAHFWLSDPYNNTIEGQPAEFYKQTSLEVYWGDTIVTDRAAIEIKIVYYDSLTTTYKMLSYYIDPVTRANGFTNPTNSRPDVSLSCTNTTSITTTSGANRPFYCRAIISSLLPQLMLARVRLLYNSTSHPVAVKATGTCGKDCSIPPQAQIFVSKGTSGPAQRIIKLFRIEKVVPPFFDFVIFSAGEVIK